MSRLTAEDRAKLPKSYFGDPARRAYPMPDEEHALAAWARFQRNKRNYSLAYRREVGGRIEKRMRAMGLVPRKSNPPDPADVSCALPEERYQRERSPARAWDLLCSDRALYTVAAWRELVAVETQRHRDAGLKPPRVWNPTVREEQRKRAALRAELGARRRATKEELAALRASCKATRAKVLERNAEAAARTRAEIEQSQRAEDARRVHRGKGLRRTAAEAREERDSAVESNLPPELVPVWRARRRHVKAGPHRSRTEAFLEWVEENPDEAIALQQDDADADVARMIAEHEREEPRAVANPDPARRYRNLHGGLPGQGPVAGLRVSDAHGLVAMGELCRVVYRTAKETEEVFDFDHGFGSHPDELWDKTRPILAVANDGLLVIAGGRYRVTKRGIVG